MSEEESIKLQAQLEEVTKLSKMKDEKIKDYEEKIKSLEQKILEYSKFGSEGFDEFLNDFITFQFNEYKNLDQKYSELSIKFFKLMAKKNKIKKEKAILKAKSIPFSPKSPTSSESEIQKLNIQILDLKAELDFTKEEFNLVSDESKKYKKELNELQELNNSAFAKATTNFNIMKQKLQEQRDLMSSSDVGKCQVQIEELQNKIKTNEEAHQNQLNELQQKITEEQKNRENIESENKMLQETVTQLEESCQKMTNGQTEFLESLGQLIGCNTIEEISAKIKELSSVAQRNRELEQTLSSVKREGNARSHDDVIDALKKIQEKLSPNELKLPKNSELRQLFAALYNMLNVALDKDTSMTLLSPHINAVIYQARSFSPASISETSQQNFSSKIVHNPPSFYDPPLTKSYK